MRAVLLHGAHDVRVDNVPMPRIVEDGDSIIKLAAACVCGSDLWAYRGIDPITTPVSMGHEYCGVMQEVRHPSVKNVKPGDFVVGSFFASDNTCEICRSGCQSGCLDRHGMGEQNCQAEYLRVPLADGTHSGGWRWQLPGSAVLGKPPRRCSASSDDPLNADPLVPAVGPRESIRTPTQAERFPSGTCGRPGSPVQ